MTSRRDFIKTALAASAALAPVDFLRAKARTQSSPVSVFSKNLQWLGKDRLGIVAAELGFEGIDLTVRPGGHVDPKNVLTELPAFVKAIENAGLKVYSIVTAIDKADDQSEAILHTASSLGIRYYRMNWLNYDESLSMPQNHERFKKQFGSLEKLNRKYQIHGAYQNHAGTSLGASIWDLFHVIKEYDPAFVGCQFDVRHAMVEGFDSWVNDFKVIVPYIKCYNVKDFKWTSVSGQAKAESVPLGTGAIDFKKYFALIKQYNVVGPISLHYEYPLGGAESGATTINVPEEQVKAQMKKDLQVLRSFI
jgi:L-ribulose-5-phosphate 3-epimerase